MEVIFYRPLESSLLNCERAREAKYLQSRLIYIGYQVKILEQGILTPKGILVTR